MLTKEQAKEIKEHLYKQLVNFPEDRRDLIKEKISAMNEYELEEFIKQNQLNHLGSEEQQCLFCSIKENKIPSFKIKENEGAIAILEINPLSKGNLIIFPKSHSNEKTLSSFEKELITEISEILQYKFSPKEIVKNQKEITGHRMTEIIPLYGNETERKKATEKELKNLQKEMLKPVVKEKKQEIVEKILIKLKPRIA